MLVDAPCSNTGVLRRRPDARWRWEQDHIKQLTDLQHDILNDAAKYVAPGGLLVYSTCSNEPEENGDQVEKFLAEHPDFEEVSRRESIPFETKHDGAFACAMKFIGKALACLLVVLMAGCASFEPTRTQKFVDEKGEYALVDYGSDKEPRTSTFTLSNGVTLPFKSKLKVRVELPNGDRFIAYQRMSTAGNLYIDEDERWEFFERGTGCVVAHRKKSDSKFEMIYQGTLCASVRNPFAEKKPTIRSDSSTPHGFGRDSSGPRTVEERK